MKFPNEMVNYLGVNLLRHVGIAVLFDAARGRNWIRRSQVEPVFVSVISATVELLTISMNRSIVEELRPSTARRYDNCRYCLRNYYG
jgi:hypothetical protein